MELALVQQILHAFLIRSGIGNNTGLRYHKTDLIIICCIVISFSLIRLFCSNRYTIFVRLFRAKRHRWLNRLMQFTRAVIGPPRQEAAGWSGWEKRVVWPEQLPDCRNKEIRLLPNRGIIRYCGLRSAFLLAER